MSAEPLRLACERLESACRMEDLQAQAAGLESLQQVAERFKKAAGIILIKKGFINP